VWWGHSCDSDEDAHTSAGEVSPGVKLVGVLRAHVVIAAVVAIAVDVTSKRPWDEHSRLPVEISGALSSSINWWEIRLGEEEGTMHRFHPRACR